MQERGRRVREGDVGMEADTADVRRRSGGRLGEEEGGQPTAPGNSKETDSPLEPPEGMQPCHALILVH